MPLTWDGSGERIYETGVDKGVLYIPDANGAYTDGVAWNGLVNVSESPSGAESSAQYADNTKYLNLLSAEEFGATLEAFTYPDEFAPFDGLGIPAASPGVAIGQQSRRSFGLAYRTLIGNDLLGTDYGYKLHLVYGCSAAPSEKAYGTVNDSPEAITLSWELTTIPAAVTGFKPTSLITINSTLVEAADLTILENLLYGASANPTLPLPDAVIAIFGAVGLTLVSSLTKPSNAGNVITIPVTTGVDYYINDVLRAAGTVTITANTIVEARPKATHYFAANLDTDWGYTFA